MIASEIMLPPHAPEIYLDRATLWNAVENCEKHPKAQLAYSFDIAMQNELTLEENMELARKFVQEQFVTKGMIADLAFHSPEKEDGGIPNPHFHVMTTMRPLNPDGTWGQKQRREYLLDEDGNRIRDKNGDYMFNAVHTTDWHEPETLEHWREQWAAAVNTKFEEKGLDVRIDHRSYVRQGLDLIPTVHEGANVRQMEAKGIRTEKGELNRWIKATNRLMQDVRKKIKALFVWMAEVKEELSKPQTPSLADLLIAYYNQRNAGAWSNKLFLMGAIRRVFRPGSKFEVMLCLVGGQGAGKSTFFRLLAGRDEWFSDDLKKLDDENVYRKLQGHWIIEMSEMIATANAKSIEEIKSFLSRQKETYKVPYETHPADRLRQCVFGGTTNRQDFLPRDRTGNRRFLPVTVYPERAEVHILDDEAAARAYIEQMWAEAMTVYRSGKYKLSFSMEMNRYLNAHQQDFMQEDTQAGMIYAYLEDYTGDRVCSKQLYEEALGNLNSPADWETRAICEIMNTGIAGGIIQGWVAYKSPKRYKKYGSQKGWERVNQAPPEGDGFQEITEEEARQMELPF